MRRFKEEQKQILIEKDRQARETEREKREQHEKEAEKQREMNMKEMKIRFGRYHGRDCETSYQEDRNYCRWVLDVETGNPAVIEFKNFIKTRDGQWEEECRERKRVELEEREVKIEENRRAAEAEAREKERIMKQIRRAKMENERMENRDNHTARDDDDTKNFTTEAKGSKTRADDLTTEAKGSNARTEESRGKSEAATRDDTIEITTKTTTMVNEQEGEFPFTMGREIPRNEVKMIVSWRTETGIQTSETGHEMGEQWENYWRNTNW